MPAYLTIKIFCPLFGEITYEVIKICKFCTEFDEKSSASYFYQKDKFNQIKVLFPFKFAYSAYVEQNTNWFHHTTSLQH